MEFQIISNNDWPKKEGLGNNIFIHVPKRSGINRLLLTALLLQTFLYFSCGSSGENSSNRLANAAEEVDVLSGKQLSKKYCQSCHLYPEPTLLDRHTWERSVLPLMGRLFGFYELYFPRQKLIEGAINIKEVEEQKIFPPHQIIREDEWRKITDFYLSEAPDSLPLIKREDWEFSPLESFELTFPTVKNGPQLVSLIKINPENSQIYVGESKGNKGALTIYDGDFETIDSIDLSSPPTDIAFEKDELIITLVGTIRLAPNNNALGELVSYSRTGAGEPYTYSHRIFGDLNRPVQTVFEDVDGNGLMDILVAEFGYYTGSLSLYLNSGGKQNFFKKIILKKVPGAVRMYVQDMDANGHKDIISLFAQGDEGISIFYNDGQGKFREERVLRFPPSYGSVYFELVDLNQDGFLDILYGNGDNGDYPPILKLYHGIRIYENDGNNTFAEEYFFPMYGVNKCSAADFDLDGDLDLVAVSYYPDQMSAETQDFVFLRNNGNFRYSPQILEEVPGLWFTFDIADLEGNGYKDVIMGAFGVKDKDRKHIPRLNERASKSLMRLKNREGMD